MARFQFEITKIVTEYNVEPKAMILDNSNYKLLDPTSTQCIEGRKIRSASFLMPGIPYTQIALNGLIIDYIKETRDSLKESIKIKDGLTIPEYEYIIDVYRKGRHNRTLRKRIVILGHYGYIKLSSSNYFSEHLYNRNKKVIENLSAKELFEKYLMDKYKTITNDIPIAGDYFLPFTHSRIINNKDMIKEFVNQILKEKIYKNELPKGD